MFCSIPFILLFSWSYLNKTHFFPRFCLFLSFLFLFFSISFILENSELQKTVFICWAILLIWLLWIDQKNELQLLCFCAYKNVYANGLAICVIVLLIHFILPFYSTLTTETKTTMETTLFSYLFIVISIHWNESLSFELFLKWMSFNKRS